MMKISSRLNNPGQFLGRVLVSAALAVMTLGGGMAHGQVPSLPGANEQPPPEQAEGQDGVAADPAAPSQPAFDAEAFIETLEFGELAENTWWNWGFLLVAIFAGLLVGRVLQAVLRRLGDRMKDRGWRARSCVVGGAAVPVNLMIFTAALSSGFAQLTLSDALSGVVARALLLLVYIAVFWYLFNLVAIIEVLLLRKTRGGNGNGLSNQLVPTIRKTLRIFLVIIAALVVAQNVFGQNIGAWLAGFGIAGLAVSLAAQDSLKNLFGSITILLDRPFRVGERIKYGEYDGTVEEIGFRSTKVRTLAGHRVTVPNSNIVNDPIENIAQRPTIRRILNVTITYDTPVEKVREAVQMLRDILAEDGIREPINPVVDGDELPPRVYFNEFNAASLNLFVIYWYSPAVWWDYLEHAERLNLRIFEAFNEAGIEFAFPTQTLHLANDPKRQLAIQMLNGSGVHDGDRM